MSLTPGTKLGPYDIVSAIGAGGMGEVYRARDTKLKRDVAIKVLPAAFAQDSDRLARFTREAQTLAALNHPNIAQIYGIEHNAIVMELVEGRDLSEIIAGGPQGPPLPTDGIPLADSLPIAKQIAEALEAAHELGIVHRDLKPANITVRADGTVKVLDFGLAKALAPPDGSDAAAALANSPTMTSPALTEMGIILGTAAYMSPEQAAGKAVDKRSDLWSFGVVLMEMLTGQRLFTGETVSHVMAGVLTKDPDWTTLPANTPPQIRRLLRRCLERDRKRRLDSAAAARFEIEDAMTALSADGGSSASGFAPHSVWQRALPWTLAALMTAALAAVVALWHPWRAIAPPRSVYRLTVSAAAGDEIPTGPVWEHFALSPDGDAIVYETRPIGAGQVGPAFFTRGSVGDTSRLFLRRFDQPEATVLRGTEGAARPMFSPDGRSIAFNVNSEGRSPFKKMSLDGGPAVTLNEDLLAAGVWGADGAFVLSVRNARLARLPAVGGKPTPPFQERDPEKGETSIVHPEALPDGSVLFTIGNGITGPHQIAVLPMQGGARKILVENATRPRYLAPDYLLFARGDTLFCALLDLKRLEIAGPAVPVLEGVRGEASSSHFSVSRDGALAYVAGSYLSFIPRSALLWLDRRGGRETSVPLPSQRYTQASVANDGKTIATSIVGDDGNGNLWIGDVARGTSARVTLVATGDYRWSSDGRRLVYRKRDRTLWSQPADQSSPEEQMFPGQDPPYGWTAGMPTPDGRAILFAGVGPNSATGSDIWLSSLPEAGRTSTAMPQAWLQTPAWESDPVLSPDGKFLAYLSDTTGRPELYIQPFPAHGPVVRVTRDGAGGRIQWIGNEIFFVSGPGTVGNGAARWTGRHLDLIMSATVETQPALTVGIAKALFTVPFGLAYQDAASDGQRFLFLNEASTATPEPPVTTIQIVINWIEELKKKMGR